MNPASRGKVASRRPQDTTKVSIKTSQLSQVVSCISHDFQGSLQDTQDPLCPVMFRLLLVSSNTCPDVARKSQTPLFPTPALPGGATRLPELSGQQRLAPRHSPFRCQRGLRTHFSFYNNNPEAVHFKSPLFYFQILTVQMSHCSSFRSLLSCVIS